MKTLLTDVGHRIGRTTTCQIIGRVNHKVSGIYPMSHSEHFCHPLARKMQSPCNRTVDQECHDEQRYEIARCEVLFPVRSAKCIERKRKIEANGGNDSGIVLSHPDRSGNMRDKNVEQHDRLKEKEKV